MLIQILRSFYSPFITLIVYNKKGVITTPSVTVDKFLPGIVLGNFPQD